MKSIRLFSLLQLIIILSLSFAQTIHQVDEGHGTIQSAIIAAQSGDIIELSTDGGLYTNSRLYINKDITIRAAEGLAVKPVMQNIDSVAFNYIIKINGTAKLALQGIDLDGDGTENGAPDILFNLITIDTNDSLSAVILKINDCNLHDTEGKLVKPYGQTGIDSLIIRNSILYNAGREGVTLFSGSLSDPPVYMDYAEFFNCTFHSITREAIKADVYSDLALIVDHCTFFDIGNGTKSHIYVEVATDVTIKNSIFQNCQLDGSFIHLESDSNIVNNIIAWDMVNYSVANTNSITDFLVSDPLFADTANYDFTLGDGSPAFSFADDGKAAGDLRWEPNLAPSLFDLQLPLDGDTLAPFATLVTFQWSKSFDLNGDLVLYSLNIVDNNKLDTTITGLTDTTFLFNGADIFVSSNVYNWHVQASDGEFTTSSADTFSFSTLNLAPSSFTLLQPSDGDTLNSLIEPITFKWNQSLDIYGDPILFSLNVYGGALDTTISAITDTTFVFDPEELFESTTEYNWYVLASDGEFTASSTDTFSFHTPNSAPSSFTLLQPTDGDKLNSMTDLITFIWNRSLDTYGDLIHYSLSVYGGALDTTISAITDTSFVFDPDELIESATEYEWYVLASDGELTTSSADTFTFISPANLAPNSFDLLNPSDGDTLSNLIFTFKWNKAIDPEDDPMIYMLNITDGIEFDSTITALTDTFFAFNGNGIFDSATEYEWYVLASDGEFTISSIDTFHFKTESVTSIGDSQNGIPFNYELRQNYPNPFNPSTTIRYGLPKAGNVKLTVFNIMGQEIAILVDEQKQAGYHLVQFKADNYASGIYYYMIESGRFRQAKKMMLIK